MKISIATVDSFTSQAFSGNPAGVVLLEEELSPDQMQSIAMEMNLSETAFVQKTDKPNQFNLRWFTPTLEIDLCGHATLASAFWMLRSGWAREGERMHFSTKSGELIVRSIGEKLEMNFPLIPTKHKSHPHFSHEFMGSAVVNSAELKKNWILELGSAKEVQECEPDFLEIAKHSEEGIIITAQGVKGYDIYSRFFGPNVGVPEDPVTGFAHCALMDYWSKKTGKTLLKAFQASKRGGEMEIEKVEDRVMIRGKAVGVMQGIMEF
ncbi:PhzF family phenazine biosynthesis protein [Algoriphagus sediminis]|uniref:PhzF family phenazine biosynthesis isomerase n=1 Tax=Algoriphagus sediminis TaxID=3057113 RepID=A0ABT7YAV8_9BACT|nr:PhzF family phenazine biosynthesis isomerase [Algoriphagus sediminis]MDN3203649.1 PhzF family phenazine biosynthesis isomerase [Algoriphagus sediminis]